MPKRKAPTFHLGDRVLVMAPQSRYHEAIGTIRDFQADAIVVDLRPPEVLNSSTVMVVASQLLKR